MSLAKFRLLDFLNDALSPSRASARLGGQAILRACLFEYTAEGIGTSKMINGGITQSVTTANQMEVQFKMSSFINIMLLIVKIISFVVTVLFAIFGIYEQIMGPAGAEKLLEKLHIPLTYNQTLFVGFAFLVLLFVSHILRAKLSGRL